MGSDTKIVNLTPHAINIPVTLRPENGEWTLPPSGTSDYNEAPHDDIAALRERLKHV